MRPVHRGRARPGRPRPAAALLRAIAGAAGLAALLALLTGLAVARRITRPVDPDHRGDPGHGRGRPRARVGPIRRPGELRELATAFDQMADALDRQEQLRRDLVADVAHELRTPIAILQAGHEALLDGVAEPTPEPAGLAARRGAAAGPDGGRPADAGRRRRRRACAWPGSPATWPPSPPTAADSLAGRFEAAGSAWTGSWPRCRVLADPRWLHQVVTNLLTNALKFTPAGGRVTIEPGPGGGRGAAGDRYRPRHPGRRAAADLRPVLARAGRRAVSGSGIGLAVAAELARAHGGQLTARSPGQGTEFTLTLPRA